MRRFLIVSVLLLAATAASVRAGDEWEELSCEDGITVWRREIEGSPIVAFKGSAVIEAPIAKVAMVLIDTSRKKEWIANCVASHNVREISENERVEYNRTEAPWPIKDRDFVYHATCNIDVKEQRVVFKLKSIDDPLQKVDEDVAVRGELIDSNYTLSKTANNNTLLVVMIQADPKGSIPKWVVNLFQKKWPRKTIEGIRAQCKLANVVEHARLKAVLEGTAQVNTLTR